jgi:RNA polymerase sigma-70 factor (ECF subfamily)
MPADVNITRVNRLFDDWYAVLVGYAARRIGNSNLAEDVVQETFYLLYRELSAGNRIVNEKAWTFCVVRREIARQVFRLRNREISLDSPEFRDFPFPAIEEQPATQGIEELFHLLSPREEEVLLLSMQAMKYREIGAALGISHNTVATMHRRAIQKLRTFMGIEDAAPLRSGKEAKVLCGNIAPIKTSSS